MIFKDIWPVNHPAPGLQQSRKVSQ